MILKKIVTAIGGFTLLAKGNKHRTVTISHAMLRAVRRYRRSLDLSELPMPNEAIPLLPKLRGKGPVTDSRGVRRIVQGCFDKAYSRMKSDGMEDMDAAELKEATVHWLG